jgi:hypothetical protein
MPLTQKNVNDYFHVSTPGTLEVKKIVVGTKNEIIFTETKNKFFGEAGIPSKYGSGPLSYVGTKTKSGSIFAGQNKSDPQKKIIVFEKGAIPQVQTLLQEENLNKTKEYFELEQLTVQGKIPFSGEMLQQSLFENSTSAPFFRNVFRELSNSQTAKFPKIVFSEKTKVLTLGSATNRQVLLFLKEEAGQCFVFFEIRLSNTPAKNAFEAIFLQPTLSFIDAAASSLVNFLQPFPNFVIFSSILAICSKFQIDDVILKKRERTNLITNTKIQFAKTGLHSILKNIPLLEKPTSQQYIPVMNEFLVKLVVLSSKEEVAKELLESMSSKIVSLGSTGEVPPGATQEMPTEDGPSKMRRTQNRSIKEV